MRTKLLLISLLFLILVSCNKKESLTEKVNPFIGTGGHGHTYPGATTPFGMVQLSPDTRIDDWDGCSGYHYSDEYILGFSHTHLSGTGVGDLGDIRMMPTVGELKLCPGSKEKPDGYLSRFSHKNESASPGFYQVFLEDYNVDVQLTATKRAGLHQYTFPQSTEAHIVLDLKEAVRTEIIHDLIINIENATTVSGLRRSGSWANDQYCYFVMEFSKEFSNYGIQSDGVKTEKLNMAQGKDLQAWFDFVTQKDEKILVKVGLSAVSVDGARQNLKTEIPHWNFDDVLKQTTTEWENELSLIRADGYENDEEIFYTALYHSLIAPNTWSDVDGSYRGHDGNIHKANHNVYTVFSLWDTFRAEHPLVSIIYTKRINAMIKSMLLMQKQGGLLPVWELAANETNCMIGYHAIPVIYDAWAKGLGDFDPNEALDAMILSAQQDHFGLDSYKKYGYVKADEEGESVSKTLEYAYDDWCIAMMAKDLGRNDIYEEFIQRAQNYKNLFDDSTGFMRAKINGQWQTPFDPSEVNFHFTEANSWQYSMFVPQDVNGLMELHGGDEKFIAKLDELFSTSASLSGREQADITGLIGQYAHGNEPSHHMAYLYNFAGAPWKGQEVLSKIMSELYTNQPDGLSGNEDCGQMSAWYVMSSMGFYPVTPGSNKYTFGTPRFAQVEMHMANDKNLIIEASPFSEDHIYIEEIIFNSEPWTKSYMAYEDMLKGGILEFKMSNKPNKSFGSAIGDRPVTKIDEHKICAAPTLFSDSKTFSDELKVTMTSHTPGSQIYFTTDGSEPTAESILYSEPVVIKKSTQFKVKAIHAEWGSSAAITSEYHQIDPNVSIELASPYNQLYAAGGDLALIDQIRGNTNFKTGTWQGYYNTNFEAIISYKKPPMMNEVGIGFIQDQDSWIFLPQLVDFYVSENKVDWVLVGSQMNKTDQKISPIIQEFSIKMYPKRVKYLKIAAKNAGACPDWHLGAGGATWLFADEIWVK
jgi:predicted alpha-1,2-mannosidase